MIRWQWFIPLHRYVDTMIERVCVLHAFQGRISSSRVFAASLLVCLWGWPLQFFWFTSVRWIVIGFSQGRRLDPGLHFLKVVKDQESQIDPWPRYFWKVLRYTSYFYLCIFTTSMPSSCLKIAYRPPSCITIRFPFVSCYFCRSIRVRGRWNTPRRRCPDFPRVGSAASCHQTQLCKIKWGARAKLHPTIHRNHERETHPPKKYRPNKNTVCANYLGAVYTNCPLLPVTIRRKMAESVCANCLSKLLLFGWVLFGVGHLSLKKQEKRERYRERERGWEEEEGREELILDI